jgi:hypothetical protein
MTGDSVAGNEGHSGKGGKPDPGPCIRLKKTEQ